MIRRIFVTIIVRSMLWTEVFTRLILLVETWGCTGIMMILSGMSIKAVESLQYRKGKLCFRPMVNYFISINDNE